MKRRLYWQVVRRTYPWIPLVQTAWQALMTKGTEHDHALLRCWILLYRIDMAGLMALAIDLTQPEYWA